MTNIARNMLASIEPQSGAPLLVDMELNNPPITTGSSGVIARLVGSGGAGGYAYSVLSGLLPTNTILDPSGNGDIITTGALVKGTYTFTIQVQDLAANTFPRTFSITVGGQLSLYPGDSYVLPAERLIAFSQTLRIAGATGTVTWNTSPISGAFPVGATLSSAGVYSSAGLNTGIVTPYTVFYFVVRASDSGTGESIDIPCSQIVYQLPPAAVLLENNASLPWAGQSMPPIIRGTEYRVTVRTTIYSPGPATFSIPAGQPAYVYLAKIENVSNEGFDLILRAEVTATIPRATPGSGALTFLYYFTDSFGVQIPVTWFCFCVDAQPYMTVSKDGSGVGSGNYAYTFNFAGPTAAVGYSGNVYTVTINALNFTDIYSKAMAAGGSYTNASWAGLVNTNEIIRLTGVAGGAATIHGMPAIAGGTFCIVNASTTTVTINNQSGTEGTAACRFAIGANLAIAPDHSAMVWYDSTSARWRVLGYY